MDEAQLHALVGHRFVGGSYRIQHWENWLLTDCTGREPMPDDVVHPVALFHVPILGVGTSISELFQLGQARGAGSVGLQGYDWQYFDTLREDVDYRMEGGIIEAHRTTSDDGAVVDRLAFQIDLYDGDVLTARVTNRWIFRRST
jgi:hypothetical protein